VRASGLALVRGKRSNVDQQLFIGDVGERTNVRLHTPLVAPQFLQALEGFRADFHRGRPGFRTIAAAIDPGAP
jgi:hypothetical protein